MELRYRVLPSLPGPDTGPASDVAIEAHQGIDVAVRVGPGATIADLAAALATALGRVGEFASGGTAPPGGPLSVRVAGGSVPAPHPDEPARRSAPRSGATVAVVQAPTGQPPPATLAPFELRTVDPGGRAGAGPVDRSSLRLTYGVTTLRATPAGGLEPVAADDPDGVVQVDVDRTVTVRATGATVRVELDGAPVLGTATLRNGQLLRVAGSVAAAVLGELQPPSSGPLRPHDGRATEWPTPDDVPDTEPAVTLPAPPGRRRTTGFPWLSAAVPLGLGIAIWAATRNLAIAGFVAAGVAFVVAAALESRRESRREHRADQRDHELALATAVTAVAARAAAWRARSRSAHPGGPVVAAGRHRPRWSRHGTGLDLSVRLGTTSLPAPVPIRVDDGGDPARRAHAAAELDRARTGPADVVVDLSRSGPLVIVGDDEVAEDLARSVVVELAGLVPPDQLRIAAVCGTHRRRTWQWLDWLPHTDLAHTGLPHTDVTHTDVTHAGVSALVVVDGDDPESRRRGLTVLDSGAAVVWRSRTDHGVPRGTSTVVRCTAADSASGASTAALLVRGRPPLEFTPDRIGPQDTESTARRWSAYRPSNLDGGPPAAPPMLADLFGGPEGLADPDRTVARWERPRSPHTTPGLAAPIGTNDGGVVVVDLALDGPHALVAGTTGSGKSELLRTWLLATALCHPPSAVNLLLVDYKGGTAFAELDELPHSVGLVTDLDGRLGDRVVTSLRAELRRRERLERERATRPPALVVAIDEFATLARELPEFVDGVVDVAQRGRSLGLHLILATQRPAGVVTDAIRANTTLRIAMRVADTDDSRDVVGDTSAARIDRRRPGTGLVRIGATPAQQVQVASSSSPVSGRTGPIEVAPLHGEPDTFPVDTGRSAPADGHGTTQLSAGVRAARGAAGRLGLRRPRRPWLPPLPDRIELLDLDRWTGTGHRGGASVLGVVDRPDEQRFAPLSVDLDRPGGLLVSGPGGSGRSTALAAVAAATCSSRTVAVHAVDRDGTLGTLLPRAADVVDHDDPDRTLRLVRRLLARTGDAPPALLLFDDVDEWCRRHERTNRGAAVDAVVRLSTEASRHGVVVVASARRPTDLPAALTTSLGSRLPLGDSGRAGRPGHGSLGGHGFLVGVPPTDRRWAVAPTPRTGELPGDIRLEELPPPRPGSLPVGVDADDLGPVGLDLRGRHLLVLGPPRSGRSSVVRTVVEQARRADPGLEVLEVPGRDPAAGRAAESVRARLRILLDRGRGAGTTPALLVLDDLDELFDLGLELASDPGAPSPSEFDSLLMEALRRSDVVHVLASSAVDGVARSFAEAPRVLRSGRFGVLLDCDPDVHPALLHTTVPRRDEVSARPGRGWLVGDGPPRLVQFARPTGDPSE